MNRKIILSIAILSLTFSVAFAQCEDCRLPEDEVSDFCYVNSSFEGYCAQFGSGSSYFKLRGDKKYKAVPAGTVGDLAYLKKIATDKKLKLSNLELLFIMEALKEWEVEERKYGYSYEENGLGIKIVQEGSGSLPEAGEDVEVHYTGYLEDGTKFDSSLDRDQTFKFQLGAGRVIKGWDQGVAKLKKGTVAWLRIPPDLGYGSRGAGRTIPPNATLIFKIEVQE